MIQIHSTIQFYLDKIAKGDVGRVICHALQLHGNLQKEWEENQEPDKWFEWGSKGVGEEEMKVVKKKFSEMTDYDKKMQFLGSLGTTVDNYIKQNEK